MVKNQLKIKKIMPLNKFWCIILVGVMLCIPSVFAFNWETTYDFTKNGNGYGTYHIYEKYLLLFHGDKLKETTLTENHGNSCGKSCYSIVEIVLKKDGSLVDGIRFYELLGSEKILSSINSYKFYLKTGETSKIVDDYAWTCEDTGILNINGTTIKNCYDKKVGTHTEIIPIWSEYNEGTILPKGTYILKLEGEKRYDISYDWQILENGIWSENWEVWGANSLQNTLGTATTDGNINAIGGYAYTGFTFTPTKNYTIQRMELYASEKVGTGAGNTYFGLWKGNASCTGITMPQIGLNSSTTNMSATGSFNFTWTNNVTNVSSGQCYWVIAYSSPATNYVRLGETNTAGTSIFGTSASALTDFNRWTSSNQAVTLNVNIYGAEREKEIQTSLNTPVNNSNSLSASNISFNCSSVQTDYNLKNVTIYTNFNGSFIPSATTKLITGNINSTIFSLNSSNIGSYLWNCYSCDNNSLCSFSNQNNTINIKNYMESVAYTTPVYASALAIFINNVSYVGTNIIATLWYNGTAYTSTKSLTGSNVTFSNSISIDSVASAQTKNFFYEYLITNSTGTFSFNSTTYNQIVNYAIPINITANTRCIGNLSTAFYFNFQNEQNFTAITPSKVNYNIQYGISNITTSVAYGSYTNINNLSICINNTMSEYSIGYGEIEYEATGFTTRKYYIFSGTRATNQTINTTLYSLDTASSTAFQLTAQTSTGVLYKNNYYIGLMRWYPQLNQYNVVEIGKTDDKGQSVFEIRTTDVDYRFAIYYLNGTIIKVLNPLKMVCTSSPCAYTIFADGTSLDYTSQFQLEDSLVYDNLTHLVTYIWNDPTQKTNAMNMSVTKITSSGETMVCSTSATGYTGVLQCDLTGQSGTLVVRIFRSASPFSYIKEKIVELGIGLLRDIGNGNGKFFALIAVVILGALGVLIGIYNPYAGIVIGCASLIPLFIWGGISVSYLIGFIILGGIVIYFIRKT